MVAPTKLQTEISLVKKGHSKNTYNLFKVQELKKSMSDPVYFLEHYMKIQHPTRGGIEFKMYPFQKELIKSYHKNRFSVALLPRQSGKTTCAAGYLLWYAMFHADSTILVAAHQYSGAAEIMQRIRYAYEEMPDFLRAGATEYNKGSITFDNGSRIISQATTEKTGRGLSLTLIYLDEFAFVEARIAKEFWTSLSPTLSTGGACIITSTPNAETDQFAQIWREACKVQDEYGNEREDGLGANGFKAFTIGWRDVPGRDEEFEAEMRSQIGDDRWLREFECEFISFEETLINPLVLKDLQGQSPFETTGRIRWYSPVLPNRIYLVGLDPSMGTGGDNGAITVWMLPEFVQVGEWIHNKTGVRGQVAILMDMLAKVHTDLKNHPEQEGRPEIYWSVENNSLGEAALVVIDDTGEELFAGDFVHEPKKKRKGFTTTNKTKIEACSKLKSLVESGRIDVRSKPLVTELKTFIKSNRSYSAQGGSTDDIVMSVLLCIRVLSEVQTYEKDIYDRLAEIIETDGDGHDPMPMVLA